MNVDVMKMNNSEYSQYLWSIKKRGTIEIGDSFKTIRDIMWLFDRKSNQRCYYPVDMNRKIYMLSPTMTLRYHENHSWGNYFIDDKNKIVETSIDASQFDRKKKEFDHEKSDNVVRYVFVKNLYYLNSNCGCRTYVGVYKPIKFENDNLLSVRETYEKISNKSIKISEI